MKKNSYPIVLIVIILLLGTWLFGNKLEMSNNPTTNRRAFEKHWFDGKAEVCSYDLEQNRYGEVRKGDAVLIFVTEDFSASRQVKLDHAELSKKDAVKVLKLNNTKEFRTGIYPYHIMTSVFTDIDQMQTLKTSHSVQEWCGHTYLQFNRKKENYHLVGHSYFEQEVETDTTLKAVTLEDELWTLIRIDPDKIKRGPQKIVASGITSRLTHVNPHIQDGTITIQDAGNGEMSKSKLEMTLGNRYVMIEFDRQFPHTIYGWEEYKDEGGKKTMIAKAQLKKKMRLPYWQLNHSIDTGWRDSLALNVK